MQVRRTISETLYYLVRMFRAGRFRRAGRRLPAPGIDDININLLKISKNDAIRRYASMLISCNFLPSKLVTFNGHTVTDEETIAEDFNSYRYFVNIGKSIADAISPGSACNFNFSATNKNSNSLFLTPSWPQEVFNVIKKLKTKKN